MSHKLVVHCKRDSYDVYIGRGSKWGNPFRIGPDGDRDEVIQKHKDSLTPEMIKQIREELKDKILGCWCAPKNCHGDTLAEIANEPICKTCGDSGVVEWEDTILGYGGPDENGDPIPVPEQVLYQRNCPHCNDDKV